jgi:aspartate 1-decarboxylase
MLLNVLKSKIHRATITQADLNYEGSITIDSKIMEAADLYENEKVHIWNVTNGFRLMTYAMMPAEAGSGVICINGAAAHHMKVGDIVIIASFVFIDKKEIKKHKPLKVLVDAKNVIQTVKHV